MTREQENELLRTYIENSRTLLLFDTRFADPTDNGEPAIVTVERSDNGKTFHLAYLLAHGESISEIIEDLSED